MRLSYHEARNRALDLILATRPEACVIGGDFSGPFEPPSGLRQKFGSDRLRPGPISEMGYAGVAVGAALGGLRPIVDFAAAGFMFNAWEMVVNEAANLCYMSGGRLAVPVVFHILAGARGAAGAQHSHAPQAMLMNVPGLKIFCPATPADVAGLLRTALDDLNPCVFVDHVRLFPVEGEVSGELDPVPFGRAVVRRHGDDATVIAASWMLHQALAAADELSARGVEVEVIDPRTLVPLDEETIIRSVGRTGRLIVVEETHLTGGVASELAARFAERCFDGLRAPVARVGTPDVPIPFSPGLEAHVVPGPEAIVRAVQSTLETRRAPGKRVASPTGDATSLATDSQGPHDFHLEEGSG